MLKVRQGVGCRVLDVGKIAGVVIYLFGGGLTPIRVVGLIVAEPGATVGVVVARLGELMCDVVREFGKAFEPAAEVYCSSLRFCWAAAVLT